MPGSEEAFVAASCCKKHCGPVRVVPGGHVRRCVADFVGREGPVPGAAGGYAADPVDVEAVSGAGHVYGDFIQDTKGWNRQVDGMQRESSRAMSEVAEEIGFHE